MIVRFLLLLFLIVFSAFTNGYSQERRKTIGWSTGIDVYTPAF